MVTRCSVQRVDLECNSIQIDKMDLVHALGLAPSGNEECKAKSYDPKLEKNTSETKQ